VSIILNAPAKVNLFLRVKGKRPDGYHNIETLFEKIALSDKITLEKMETGISVVSDEPALPLDGTNLAYQAASAVMERCSIDSGVRIAIEKRIPIGAGLGGGSSNAAAVLRGANDLFAAGLSTDELKELAGRIGADVPFFLSDKSWAIGRETGDEIEEIECKAVFWHIIIAPRFEIRAGEAYAWFDNTGATGGGDLSAAVKAATGGDIRALKVSMHNDLEGLALERSEDLRRLKRLLLEEGAAWALITGSGPALFGITQKEREVARLRGIIEEELARSRMDWKVFTAPTLTN